MEHYCCLPCSQDVEPISVIRIRSAPTHRTSSSSISTATFHLVRSSTTRLPIWFLCQNLVWIYDSWRGPLSLVSTTEEPLDRKVEAPVYKTENTAIGIRHADHVAPSISKSWQSLLQQAAVARSVWFACGLRPCSFFMILLCARYILFTSSFLI
jgi:hypothetical protein